MTLDISCAFATSMTTPDHVVTAEKLGYTRAWLYDSPALYPDVWVQLCRAAERTSTIGLGPGVLIPSLRHPMVTAAAIGTLTEIAGMHRVHVGVGTGFTGRFTLGQKPNKWASVVHYVETVQALLRGDIVEWEGAKIQMMHPDGYSTPRPIRVPFVLGAAGPKGFKAAQDIADGVFVAGADPQPNFDWQVMLHVGTVLDDNESPGSERAIAAGGHGAAVYYHFFDENGLGVEQLPGGAEWKAAYANVEPSVRHLAIHDLHMIAVNKLDQPLITGEVMQSMGAAFSPARLREVLHEFEEKGATELAYQPAGPDITRELEKFITAAHG
ncbi:MAG: LLM class flavin-dependent oxidoreductase [Actinobacteria bacterium]|uniref:Unannotated protein n=1 Tax=freshwater metagenome TaxID=449393 RepID=A0A6J6AGW9_9ZZZZ|nr:LLM class flavin-dependent oxidoreductase [Actinomycetota bacterium]